MRATLAVLLLAGCTGLPSVSGGRSVSPAPEVPWSPPAGAIPRDRAADPARRAELPADLGARIQRLTLAEIVDIGLRNNPATRFAWANARTAAATYGAERGTLLPTIDGDVTATRVQTAATQGRTSVEQSVLTPSVTLSHLLFDFGGRSGRISGARQRLIAASFTHNAAIQDAVLQIQVAYFQYLANRALLDAQRSTLEEAQTNLTAAEERRRVGLATVADVLQARTAASQAQLDLQRTEGNLQTSRGALALALGLPANLPYDVDSAAAGVPVAAVADSVDAIIATALVGRPDLAAVRAEAEAARVGIGEARAQLLRLALAFSAVILVGTVVLFRVVPKGFIPTEDQSQLNGTTETAEGTSYDAMVEHQRTAAAIVAEDPNIDGFMSAVGAGGRIGTVNQGRLIIHLKDRADREMSADEVARSLSGKLAAVPGMRAFISNPPVLNIGGRSSKSEYQFTLTSSDMEALYEGSAALESRMGEIPGLTDVTSDLQIKNPQVQVQIERDRAAALGIDVNQIESALYNAYGARQVSTIYTPNDQYWVVMELLPQYQRDLSAMDLLHVTGREGVSVPLGSLAKITPGTGPLTVNHSGQLPSVTLSFNLEPGTSLGTAVERVEAAAREVLPSTISTSFAGTAQAFQEAQAGMLLLLLMAILVIYLVLGILYESFIHPLTILSGLPFAGFGALLALFLFGIDLSIYAYVGIIMLVGIVKKNAIMMIDFAIEAERNHGKSAHDAILEAASVRFRPIIMTTMAALMGTLPIALGHGAGAEARRPLGIAVVGGLVFSQIITLYFTPVIYTYFDALQQRLGRRKRVEQPVRTPSESPVPAPAGAMARMRET